MISTVVKSKPILNLLINIFFQILRYGLVVVIYRQLTLEDIGNLNLFFNLILTTTLIAGLEIHKIINRDIIIKDVSQGIYFLPRLIISIIIVAVCANFFTYFVSYEGSVLLLMLIIFLEYLSVELGRLLIIESKYILNSILGGLRALTPFIIFYLFFELNTAVFWYWATALSIICLVALMSVNYNYFSLSSSIKVKFKTVFYYLVIGTSPALFLTLDRIIIGNYSDTLLGVYSLIAIIIMVFDLLTQSLVIQPNYTSIVRNLKDLDKIRLFKISTVFFIFPVIFGFALNLFGAQYFKIFNVAYEGSINIFIISVLLSSKFILIFLGLILYSRLDDRMLFFNYILILAIYVFILLMTSFFNLFNMYFFLLIPATYYILLIYALKGKS